MYKNNKFLAIIPARGGSKGVPGKNIKLIHGKPLIAWSIQQALASRYLDRIIVSTDSREIASVSEELGIKVPFLRPPELARDESPTIDAVIHVLDQLENEGQTFDYILLLEPTSPLRKQNDIDQAITSLCDFVQDADGLVSVGEVHMEHPLIVKRINSYYLEPYISSDTNIYQRQQTDKAYFPYGVAYIVKTSVCKLSRTIYTEKSIPYYIERWQNYEIDDEIDFFITELLMKKFLEN